MPGTGNIIGQAKLDSSQISFSTKFNMALNAVDDPARALAMELPSTAAVEEHKWLGMVPGFSEWDDERRLDNIRAENITIANKDFASGIRIDKNDILVDRLGIVMPRIGQLGEKAALHYGQLLVELLVAGFSIGAKYGSAYDGKAFFAADHQDGEDGPVQSNTGAATALTKTAYFAARAQMWSLRDEHNDPLGIVPNTLIVGPDLEEIAYDITKAEIVPDGAGAGVTNTARGTANVIISPRLSGADSTKWFLASLGGEAKPLILQIREAISSSFIGDGEMPAFMRKQLYFGAQGRHNVGFALWQHIHGNLGA